MLLITTHITPVKKNKKPVFKRKKNKSQKTGGSKCSKSCCICLEKITKENSVALPCAHVFHSDCINKWININPSCPLCKQSVNRT